MVSRLLRFAPAVCLGGAIFWVSGQPQLPPPPVAFEGLDKILHALAYALLTICLAYGGGWRRPWLWVVLAASYGVADEIHQSFVPGREADPLDLLADAAGTVGATAVWVRARAAQWTP